MSHIKFNCQEMPGTNFQISQEFPAKQISLPIYNLFRNFLPIKDSYFFPVCLLNQSTAKLQTKELY